LNPLAKYHTLKGTMVISPFKKKKKNSSL
jgi:hypothetical protein